MADKHGWWVAYMPDIRGYTNEFMCSDCGAIISIETYEKECNYSYCPWCGCDMIDNAGEVNGMTESQRNNAESQRKTPDREKVIRHFQDAISASGAGHRWRFVHADIIEDAIALLTEQETHLVHRYSGPGVYADLWFYCEVCGGKVDDDSNPKFCPNCGRKVIASRG